LNNTKHNLRLFSFNALNLVDIDVGGEMEDVVDLCRWEYSRRPATTIAHLRSTAAAEKVFRRDFPSNPEMIPQGLPLNYLSERDSHLITFQSGGHNTQIDYLLVRKGDLKACKDCRAFPGEACLSQHRLIIMDVLLERLRHRREATGRPRILWKNLNGEAIETFRATVVERLAVEDMSASNADQIWNTLACVMKDAAKDSLGVASARTHSTHRESWWFCEEVQTKVATKQSRFKDLLSCSEGNQEDIDKAKERYKVAKREAKIVVAKAKDKAYEDLYKKLDSKEGVLSYLILYYLILSYLILSLS
nr:hypothetical protein [Tanacetum cinerariifolium]